MRTKGGRIFGNSALWCIWMIALWRSTLLGHWGLNDSTSVHWSFFSCPGQLNRWPCHSLSQVTFYFNDFRTTMTKMRLMTTMTTVTTQGGRTWQPFVGSKNGNENFRQARIYNFRVKRVVFAHNRKFAKSTQWNMLYIPWNSALLALETLFLTPKGIFLAQRSPKSA